MRKRVIVLAAAWALLSGSSQLQATVVLPIGSTPETGTQIDTTGTVAFNNGVISGTIRESVFRESNGTLSFAYQYVLNGGANGDIARLTGFSYVGFTVSLDQTSTASGFAVGTLAATSGDRSGAPGDSATVGFNYDPAAAPTVTSFVEIVRTNATNYVPGLVSLIDGATFTTPGFSPAAATPEPASLALLAGMMVGGAGIAYRRRFKGRPHAG